MQGQTVQQQRPKPPVLGTWRGAPRRLLTSALYSTKAALLQAPGLHDAAQELGASHCQCETKAKLGGPKQRRSHLCHRGTPSWSCGVLAPVSGAPGARAAQPKTEPLLWMNAACNWPLLLGKGGPIKTRPGAKSGGLRHKRPAQKPGQDCQRQSQVRQRRRKGCLGRCRGLRPPSKPETVQRPKPSGGPIAVKATAMTGKWHTPRRTWQDTS